MRYRLTKEDIREGPITPPKNAVKLGEFGCYELWYDNKKNEMVFFATDYHAGILRVSGSGLEKMFLVTSNQVTPEEVSINNQKNRKGKRKSSL